MPGKLLTHYRQRAATEPPRELRWHPPETRYTLLAALCRQRQREITDTLVDLLMHIAHRVGVRAEKKVDIELLKYVKKIAGKTSLLYTIAKAAAGQPDGTVKEVIFPAVSEVILGNLIQEVEANREHEHRVKVVVRASDGYPYRRIVPALLGVLSFQCNNDLHRPVMDALSLLEKYRDDKADTLMIQQVLAEPEWRSRLTAVDLRALSPLKCQHINPYGTFTLNMNERLPLA